jgi:hypothetical protein
MICHVSVSSAITGDQFSMSWRLQNHYIVIVKIQIYNTDILYTIIILYLDFNCY